MCFGAVESGWGVVMGLRFGWGVLRVGQGRPVCLPLRLVRGSGLRGNDGVAANGLSPIRR